MLWAVFFVLLSSWVFGLVTQVAGGMIHLLLVAAAAVALMSILLSGRRSVYKRKLTNT
ncbi:MAG TPA: lmo0937 family membrane protein [Candidatus Binatia bacterium]|jgi:hypothetical protein|nr:lmo0937 family membrane protein [Candidatus Binatia bacterium]